MDSAGRGAGRALLAGALLTFFYQSVLVTSILKPGAGINGQTGEKQARFSGKTPKQQKQNPRPLPGRQGAGVA